MTEQAAVPGWTNSADVGMIAVYMTGAATILLLCVPFIPGLRDIPRLIPGTSSSDGTGTARRPDPAQEPGGPAPQSQTT